MFRPTLTLVRFDDVIMQVIQTTSQLYMIRNIKIDIGNYLKNNNYNAQFSLRMIYLVNKLFIVV